MMEGLITRSLRNDFGSSRQDGIAAIKSTNHGQQARACPEMDERGTRREGKGHHCVEVTVTRTRRWLAGTHHVESPRPCDT